MNRPLPFPLASRTGDPGSLAFLRLLWAISHAMQRRSAEMAREKGVTSLQRLILRVVGEYPSITLSQLAAVLHLHASTLTEVVQRLQKRALLLRKIDANDRRRSRLTLTPKGKALTGKSGTVEAVLGKVLARQQPRDVAAAERVLAALGEELSRP